MKIIEFAKNIYKIVLNPVVLFLDSRWKKNLKNRLKTEKISLITSNCIGGGDI